MTMPPSLHKFALTAHVTCSVGWLGAVAGFLALALAGLTSLDTRRVHAAYLAMDVITSFVIVPLCLAALLTGLVQSLGTPWGMVRHYWVVAKLVITVPSTIILLTHVQAIQYMADVAAELPLADGDFRQLRIQLAASAGAALLALLVTTALSVFKPRGLTPYGQRRQREQRSRS